jgi:signal transduction histidine kinase
MGRALQFRYVVDGKDWTNMDKANILLVDDKLEGLRLLTVVLEDPGYNLVPATSGEAALRELLKQEFAVILLDVRMPGMDGFETAQLIRQHPRTRDIPIIFVTGESSEVEHVSRGYALSAVDYIVKPFDHEVLRTKVAVLVELYHKTEEVKQQADRLRQEIAERERLQEEMRAVNRDLETLLYVVSHDLKEPLRAIENFSRMVNDRYADRLDEKGQDFLRRVVRAAERMARLLDDITALSRIQRMELPTEEVEGEAVARDALARLEATVKNTGATVRVAQDLPRLRANKVWVTEAVYNLIANALKFTCAGAAPEVEIAPYRPQAGEPQGVGIVVGDRGPGVAPEHREMIFELFRRAVGHEIEGTGAGLAIVRQVARRHGGRAWVRPREGGGSEFIITFGTG